MRDHLSLHFPHQSLFKRINSISGVFLHFDSTKCWDGLSAVDWEDKFAFGIWLKEFTLVECYIHAFWKSIEEGSADVTILKTVTSDEFLLVGNFLSLWVDYCLKLGDYDFNWWWPEGSITSAILETLRYLIDSYKEWRWVVSLDGELRHGPTARFMLIT